MRIAKQIEDCAIIKIDLLNLETSTNQPQLKTLLSSGWEVISSLPIEDQGKPYLILILRSPDFHTNKTKNKEHYIYMAFLFVISAMLLIEILIKLNT